MTTEEHNLLEYLNKQFPATVGHLPLLYKIHAVWQSGMTSATQIMRHEINTCHGYSVGCQPCVARENSIVDIEQARDAARLPNEKADASRL
jgi:hypothetical protein